MVRDYVILIFSVLLLVFLSLTSLPWYTCFAAWLIAVSVVYTMVSAHDHHHAKSLKGLLWKEGMIITMMSKEVDSKFLANPFFGLLRLSGFSYLHSAIIVSDPNYKSDGKSPTKLRVLELVSFDNSDSPGKIVHNHKKFRGKINSYPLEEYLEHVENKGPLLFRVYSPPKQLKGMPLNTDVIDRIREQKTLFCVGFSHQYLSRMGYITNSGYQSIPALFRYNPIQLDHVLKSTGWVSQVYKK
jgi:hypothetical protein